MEEDGWSFLWLMRVVAVSVYTLLKFNKKYTALRNNVIMSTLLLSNGDINRKVHKMLYKISMKATLDHRKIAKFG